jgi:hypothetical protein
MCLYMQSVLDVSYYFCAQAMAERIVDGKRMRLADSGHAFFIIDMFCILAQSETSHEHQANTFTMQSYCCYLFLRGPSYQRWVPMDADDADAGGDDVQALYRAFYQQSSHIHTHTWSTIIFITGWF